MANHKGELVAVKMTPGNVDDRNPVAHMNHKVKAKLFADKGYISNALLSESADRGLSLVISIKINMKSKVLSLFDKCMLKKRVRLKSVYIQLQNVFYIEHTRHRSPINGFWHIMSALIAYCVNPNKPTANIAWDNNNNMQAFS